MLSIKLNREKTDALVFGGFAFMSIPLRFGPVAAATPPSTAINTTITALERPRSTRRIKGTAPAAVHVATKVGRVARLVLYNDCPKALPVIEQRRLPIPKTPMMVVEPETENPSSLYI
jgi:hypothetical protein